MKVLIEYLPAHRPEQSLPTLGFRRKKVAIVMLYAVKIEAQSGPPSAGTSTYSIQLADAPSWFAQSIYLFDQKIRDYSL